MLCMSPHLPVQRPKPEGDQNGTWVGREGICMCHFLTPIQMTDTASIPEKCYINYRAGVDRSKPIANNEEVKTQEPLSWPQSPYPDPCGLCQQYIQVDWIGQQGLTLGQGNKSPLPLRRPLWDAAGSILPLSHRKLGWVGE